MRHSIPRGAPWLVLIAVATACAAAGSRDAPPRPPGRFVLVDFDPPDPEVRSQRETLSPELEYTVRTRMTLVGLTPSGSIVFEVPPDSEDWVLSEAALRDTLARRLDGAEGRPVVSGHDGGEYAFTSELILVLEEGASKQAVVAPSPEFAVFRPALGPFVVVSKPEGPPGWTPADLRALSTLPGVRYIEPNYPYATEAVTPDDEHWTQGDMWAHQQIASDVAWESVTGSPVIVAVLDTGIDLTHPDLGVNIWTNEGEFGPPGTDDDGNSLIDDRYGYDFVDLDGDPSFTKRGHGTHISGIIGAVGNNQIGVVGVCWNVEIMMLRVLDDYGNIPNKGNNGSHYQAFYYAVANGASIINCSWGYVLPSLMLQVSIDHTQAHGLLVVAAAGNLGLDLDTPWTVSKRNYPACFTNDNIIAVMATSKNQAAYALSNYGMVSIDIAAPGEGIWSTWMKHLYKVKSGRSQATAFVSGAAALMWAHPAYANAAYDVIKQDLMDEAQVLASLKGKNQTSGMLNLAFLGP